MMDRGPLIVDVLRLNFARLTTAAIFAEDNSATRYARRVRAMGICDHPTAPRSPWQNGYVERLIGSVRRECLDHFIVFGEADLRRTLKAYAPGMPLLSASP